MTNGAGELLFYADDNGAVRLHVRTLSEHLGNIFDEGELHREATVRRFRIVRTEGSREVSREVDHDSLPALLAVGFRVCSVDKRTLMRCFTLADRERRPISETPSRISVSPTPSTRPIGVKDEAAQVADWLVWAGERDGGAGMLPRALMLKSSTLQRF